MVKRCSITEASSVVGSSLKARESAVSWLSVASLGGALTIWELLLELKIGKIKSAIIIWLVAEILWLLEAVRLLQKWISIEAAGHLKLLI